ncbi:MmcQ/YjbR family DNA-binding protein [Aurantivibrio plasticivorans]
MDKQQAKHYLLSKPEAKEDFPFGDKAAVFKIAGKMFALLSRHQGRDILNLKCDPDESLALRDIFPGIIPGYHMNKRHWNTLFLDNDLVANTTEACNLEAVPDKEVERLIDHSYTLVVRGLRKAERLALELRQGTEALYR